MKMVNLELSKKETKEMMQPMAGKASDGPKFPYGSRLNFESDILDKMPSLKSLEVGEYVVIRAIACVTNKSQNESKGGKKRFDMAFQIEQIAIDKRDDAQAAFDEAVNDSKK